MKKNQNNIFADFFGKLRDSFHTWRLSFELDIADVIKAVVLCLLMVVWVLFQTIFFARFRIFGAIPDLMLPFVIAVGTLEREKWGSAFALIGAFVLEATSGATLTILPLLYVPVAIAVGLLTVTRFRDSFATAALFTAISALLRCLFTFVLVLYYINGISVGTAIHDFVIPEFFATLIFAPIVEILTRLCLKPFHKTRAQRVGKQIK